MAESSSTPTTSQGVTGPWLEAVLSQYEDRSNPGSSVVVNSFQVKPGVAAGENFQSELVKISVEATIRQKGEEDGVTKRYNLVAKFLFGPYTQRNMQLNGGGPQKELMIYREIVPRLNQFQAEVGGDRFQIQVPGFIYGIFDGPLDYVLLLEDVRPSGYANNDKLQGLGLNQMLMAVERLAWLHAVSFAFDKKHNFKESFPEYKEPNSLYMNTLRQIHCFMLGIAIEFLQKIGKNDLAVKLQQNSSALKNKIASLMQPEDESMKVLCHGDYWNNNMMFKAKEVGVGGLSDPAAIVLLDWGTSMWGQSPVRDIHYLLNTSTTLEFRRNHKEEVLRHYYYIFTTTAATLGAPVPSFTYEVFEEELRKFSLIGVTWGFMVSLMSLSDGGKELTKQRDEMPPPATSGFGFWLEKLLGGAFMSLLFYVPGVMNAVWRQHFKPAITSCMTGKEPILEARLVDLLTEADEYGIFDA